MSGQPQKGTIPIFKAALCSGCLSCQISCAALHGGVCGPRNAMVRVIAPLSVAPPALVVSSGCDCPDGEEACQEVCGPGALRFLAAEDMIAALADGWQLAPAVE